MPNTLRGKSSSVQEASFDGALVVGCESHESVYLVTDTGEESECPLGSETALRPGKDGNFTARARGDDVDGVDNVLCVDLGVVEHVRRRGHPARVVAEHGGEEDPIRVEGLFAGYTGSRDEKDGVGLGGRGAGLTGEAGIESGLRGGEGRVGAVGESLDEGSGGSGRGKGHKTGEGGGELHLEEEDVDGRVTEL